MAAARVCGRGRPAGRPPSGPRPVFSPGAADLGLAADVRRCGAACNGSVTPRPGGVAVAAAALPRASRGRGLARGRTAGRHRRRRAARRIAVPGRGAAGVRGVDGGASPRPRGPAGARRPCAGCDRGAETRRWHRRLRRSDLPRGQAAVRATRRVDRSDRFSPEPTTFGRPVCVQRTCCWVAAPPSRRRASCSGRCCASDWPVPHRASSMPSCGGYTMRGGRSRLRSPSCCTPCCVGPVPPCPRRAQAAVRAFLKV